MSGKKIWMGETPTECQLCGCKLVTIMYDSPTRQGPWGLICSECKKTQPSGGQKYRLTDGVWVKE